MPKKIKPEEPPKEQQRRTLLISELPPSTNHSHMIARRGKGVWRIRKPETVAFMDRVRESMEGMVPLEGPVAVSYTFYFATNARDTENALKTTSDAISATREQKQMGAATGFMLHNDRQIVELHAKKVIVGKSGTLRVEVEAWTL